MLLQVWFRWVEKTGPTVAGDFVVCMGISEAGAGSDVASKLTYQIANFRQPGILF